MSLSFNNIIKLLSYYYSLTSWYMLIETISAAVQYSFCKYFFSLFSCLFSREYPTATMPWLIEYAISSKFDTL